MIFEMSIIHLLNELRHLWVLLTIEINQMLLHILNCFMSKEKSYESLVIIRVLPLALDDMLYTFIHVYMPYVISIYKNIFSVVYSET